jgi:peptidyl-prolyl cis-trans isomerase C
VARALALLTVLAACSRPGEDLSSDPAEVARDPEKVVVARVGQDRFTLADVQGALRQHGDFALERYQAAQGKLAYLSAFVDFEVLVREAVSRGLHRTPAATRALKAALARALWEKGALPGADRKALTDERLRAFHARHLRDFLEPEKARAAQILVKLPEGFKPLQARAKAQERARSILRELGPRPSAADFAAAARRNSDDEQSRERGGDLGYLVRGVEGESVPAEVVDAAFALGPGERSEPVASALGFHILRLEKRVPGRPAAFESVRKQVGARLWQEMRRDALARLVAELRKTAKVEIDPAQAKALGEREAD